MSKPILFYDIATKLGTSTSFNTLKTELSLRYKRIPYETVWVGFEDIERVAKEIGASPTSKKPDGRDLYTMPMIRDQETGQVISDSFRIASYLDKKYPERSLIPAGTETTQQEFVNSLFGVLGMDVHVLGAYGVHQQTPDPSKPAQAECLRRYHVDISPIKTMSREEKRAILTSAFDRLAVALDAQGGSSGHFIGDSPTFADVAVAAYVEWAVVTTGEAEHVLESNGGRWKKLLAEVMV